MQLRYSVVCLLADTTQEGTAESERDSNTSSIMPPSARTVQAKKKTIVKRVVKASARTTVISPEVTKAALDSQDSASNGESPTQVL